jgi:hypothetical protein
MDFKKSIRFKTLSQLKVEGVINLPLDGYRAMLNIGPLGGEGVPFDTIVFCSIAEQNVMSLSE